MIVCLNISQQQSLWGWQSSLHVKRRHVKSCSETGSKKVQSACSGISVMRLLKANDRYLHPPARQFIWGRIMDTMIFFFYQYSRFFFRPKILHSFLSIWNYCIFLNIRKPTFSIPLLSQLVCVCVCCQYAALPFVHSNKQSISHLMFLKSWH